jgi:N-acetylmuramoyl-L-alanine amidase
MKHLFVALIILLLFSTAFARVDINVIYPRENQQIPQVDSTFIFGNVPPGSQLSVNGVKVPIYNSGGWITYLKINPGLFTFHITASRKGETSTFDRTIQVGPIVTPESVMAKQQPQSPHPGSKAIYFVGDTFEFSYIAPRNGNGWFQIDDCDPVNMFQSDTATQISPDSALGKMPRIGTIDSTQITYIGYYRFADTDTGTHTICYGFHNKNLSEGENPVVYRKCLDSILTVLPEFPPVVGKLKGQSQIVRTGPQLGYKLLYQPPGIMIHVTGLRDDFYQLSLADAITGYVNVDSVELMPRGTALPDGRISYITVDTIAGAEQISADVGAQVPYEINETIDPPKLEVDLYGVTGAVDWIRYSMTHPLAKIVQWSQPQDEVFRMSIDVAAARIWGYKAYYDGTKFILKIKNEPKHKRGSLKGLKIAIDPGHSHDPGAIGPTGLREADANLAIALALRNLLTNKGATVMMTRTGNEDVKLHDRPVMAEKWGADILISVHNNALPDGTDPFENNGTAAYYYHPHSMPLAEAIHSHMLKDTKLRDDGLYYGNLVLTRPSAMPSVLIECAFMIIPEQEAMLRTAKFQKTCAKAIMEGLEDFVKGK